MTITIIVLQGVAIGLLLLLLERTHRTVARLMRDIQTIAQMLYILRDQLRDARDKP
jgi:hypothetical protein